MAYICEHRLSRWEWIDIITVYPVRPIQIIETCRINGKIAKSTRLCEAHDQGFYIAGYVPLISFCCHTYDCTLINLPCVIKNDCVINQGESCVILLYSDYVIRMLGKNFSRRKFEILSYFWQKIDFGIHANCLGENLRQQSLRFILLLEKDPRKRGHDIKF